MSPGPYSLVLVDDEKETVEQLGASMRAQLDAATTEVRTWAPRQGEDPLAMLDGLIDDDTILVVTDWDLSTGGQTGFFGPTIVSWCQQRSVPVGDFSRKTPNALPQEPNFFELRVPSEPDESATFVLNAFRGFLEVRRGVEANADRFASLRSPAAVLATLLGRPEAEAEFALYSPRLGSASGSLLQQILRTAPADIQPSVKEKVRLLGYVAGHVLLNAVLKFPGPILSRPALCAYFAADDQAFPTLSEMFDDCRYSGPFGESGEYFWREAIDERLESMRDLLSVMGETIGELNRSTVEASTGTSLPRHACLRCGGLNGGFYCPFTKRPVCTRSDCSVSSSSWLPDGARSCRIEEGFYDEWAPLLGL